MQWWQIRKRNADLDRELRSDLELEEDEQRENGLPPEEGRYAAMRALGNTTLIKEQTHEAWGWARFERLGQDTRYAVRQLRRKPGFTLAAVLTLALGIGANTAVFSVIDATLLKPLGYPNADRIVQFFLVSQAGAAHGASIPDFRFWLERVDAVQDVAAFDFGQAEMGLTSGTPEQVHGIHVTSNYFRLFGVPLLLGRTFSTEEDRPGNANVVVLSEGLWRSKFGGDQQIVGKQISLDRDSYTVVGVASRSFRFEPEAQLWIPFRFNLNSTDELHSFGVVARLKQGVTLAQANAQLDSASDAARREGALPDPNWRFELRPFRDAMTSDVHASLLVLQGAVILVLLIACANLANLLLIQTTVRRREFAIRGAIGAGRGRLARQLLTESLLLFSLGCIAGIALGLGGAHAVLTASPVNLPFVGRPGLGYGLDWRVFGFAGGLALVTAVLFGSIPVVAVCRKGLEDALREGSNRQGAGMRQRRSRSLIAMSEIALSLVLVIGATLLIRTFIALNKVDPGFDERNVLLMTMPLRGAQYDTAAGVASMVERGREQLSTIPGVEDSAATFSAPFASRMGLPFVSVSDQSSISGDGEWLAVSPGYLHVLGIPILRGRGIDEEDKAGAPGVVLINDSMAKKFWPDQNPLGREIVIGKGLGPKFIDTPRRIIGVIGDVRDQDVSQGPEPTMIIPDAQMPDGLAQLQTNFGPIWWLVRARNTPQKLIPGIAEHLRDASAGRPVGTIRSMSDVLSRSIARQRFNMLLLSIFASIALLLAAVGIYGVIAHSVAQRTHEIGVRMALGADRIGVRNMILREALTTWTVGAACGLCAAFFLVRLLSGWLFGVSTRDPSVFVSAPVFLLLVAIVAAWLPASRAARLDPAQTLRAE
jgi:putative ABC transport system permease protein